MAAKEDKNFDEIETAEEELEIDFTPDEADTVATGYEIAICPAENEMRIMFRNDLGEIISSYVCDAANAYEMASKMLKGYDKLEGI